jgi:hypothetical protein
MADKQPSKPMPDKGKGAMPGKDSKPMPDKGGGKK